MGSEKNYLRCVILWQYHFLRNITALEFSPDIRITAFTKFTYIRYANNSSSRRDNREQWRDNRLNIARLFLSNEAYSDDLSIRLISRAIKEGSQINSMDLVTPASHFFNDV